MGRSPVILRATAYRIVLSTSFLAWGTCFVVLYFGSFSFAIRRDDLFSLAQMTAGLGALALAVLAFLTETASRDRYFKLLLAGLLILFLLVTTTGLLSAWTEYSAEQNFKILHFRVLVVLAFGICYAGVGLTGLLTNLPPLLRRPLALRVQGLYDYSIFIIPAGLLGFWPTALSIAGVTVLAAMAGLVLLLVSAIVLLVTVWRARTHGEQLQQRILEILQSIRAEHRHRGTDPQPVSLDYLRNRLLSNEATILEEIEELRRDDRLVQVGYHAYYVLEPADLQRCTDALASRNVILLGAKLDETLWTEVLDLLSRETSLPSSVLREYFAGNITEFVEHNYEKIGMIAYPEDAVVWLRPGALDTARSEIRARLKSLIMKDGSGQDIRTIGHLAIEVLGCAPPRGEDWRFAYADDLVGEMVCKQRNYFLEDSDWNACFNIVVGHHVVLFSESLIGTIGDLVGIPREAVRANYKERIEKVLRQRFDFHEARYVRSTPYDKREYSVCVRRDIRGNLYEAMERVYTSMECAGDTEPATTTKSSPMDAEEQIEEHLMPVFDVLPKEENTTAFWEWIVQKRAGPWMKYEKTDT